MMDRTPRLFLVSFALLSALSHPAAGGVAAAGTSPCAGALAPVKTIEGSPESAIARAWLELVLPESEVSPTREAISWLEGISGMLRGGSGLGPAFDLPPSLHSSDIVEGLEALHAVVTGLSLRGSVDADRLGPLLGRSIDERLAEVRLAGDVHSGVEEDRSQVRLKVHSVRVGGALESGVLELENGTIVAASVEGRVVFAGRDGKVLARHALQRTLCGAPVLLGGGKVLLLSGLGRSLLFDADGSSFLEVETPEVDPGVRPLVLDDGSLMIPGRFGEMMVLSADGMSAVKTWAKERHAAQPVRMADGRIALGTEEGDLKFYSASGQLLKRVDIGAKLIHDVTQLSDGTLVVAEEFSRVHLLNADGSPKRNWVGWPTHVDLKKRIAFAPIALPDGRAAVVASNGLVTVMTSSGKVDFQVWTSTTIGIPPLLLDDGSLLLATGEAGQGSPETEFFRITPAGESITVRTIEDSVTSEPVLLPGGGVAFGTRSGEWVVLDPLAPQGTREFSRGRASGALRMRSAILSDGGIAIGGDSGELLLLDPELAKEGFSF